MATKWALALLVAFVVATCGPAVAQVPLTVEELKALEETFPADRPAAGVATGNTPLAALVEFFTSTTVGQSILAFAGYLVAKRFPAVRSSLWWAFDALKIPRVSPAVVTASGPEASPAIGDPAAVEPPAASGSRRNDLPARALFQAAEAALIAGDLATFRAVVGVLPAVAGVVSSVTLSPPAVSPPDVEVDPFAAKK